MECSSYNITSKILQRDHYPKFYEQHFKMYQRLMEFYILGFTSLASHGRHMDINDKWEQKPIRNNRTQYIKAALQQVIPLYFCHAFQYKYINILTWRSK